MDKRSYRTGTSCARIKAVGHPSELIALRLPPHTSERLSFFPFFLLKNAFAGVEEDVVRLFHLKLYIMDITLAILLFPYYS